MKISLFLFSLALINLIHCSEAAAIRIGTNVWPGYEPLYLASYLNAFHKNTRLVEFSSATEVIRAFENDKLEMAALTLDEALKLKAAGYDIKIVLILDISNGADVLLSKPGIKKPGDLKNKRIGVENSALGAFFLARFLEIHKMSVNDIKIISLEVDSHAKAFTDGMVDALITFEPVRTALLNKGANLLFDSSQIPNEIIDVLIVQTKTYKKHKQRVDEVIDGWFKALDFMKTDFEKSHQLSRARLKQTKSELQKTYTLLQLGDKTINERFLYGIDPFIDTIIPKLYRVMKKNNIIGEEIDVKSLH